MKILQVISYFYPAWGYGGPGKLVYEIAKSLADKKQDVTVFSTDAFNRERRRKNSDYSFDQEKFRVYFFANLSNFLAYRYKLFIPLLMFFRVLKDLPDFDLIHLHEFFTATVVIVATVARFYRIPYLISPHGTLDSFNLEHRSFFKKIFMKLFGLKIIKNAAGFAAATSQERKSLVKLGISGNKIHLVQNGLDTSEFQNMPPRGSFRKKFHIPDSALILFYLGRIHHLKGLDILVRSFSMIHQKQNIYLVIAGSDDGFLPALKKLVKKEKVDQRVIFPGVISGYLKLQAYRDADLFVYPSPSEGFSIAVLEAAASGLPLVITTGCKFPEIEKYQAGIIVSSTINGLYQGLNKLIKDKKYLLTAGINARKMVTRYFTITSMTDNLKKIYQQGKINYTHLTPV
ncbi:hypothetical protein A3D78_01220 [Candidatus Gottesmanbacteria bacterium RIFCSPHIGHO2_02_FULL_39_14]|uniref:Glycosyltransferase subfamily 4-like N-terminal domain-containing protein n=1 Tax=Candidatus Gottesmanbacteria bacterium RIFCSPHIGHO2_02_FULL_39_14 TaxID=1798383 RepID=A0A1F5ZV57_9BACT|nr:MAG: hypothetical protein A3D78_01220 [Candidatus Gottesmanbacteria bacterium RIFCSPHIGHO2_02_FULL_39_14]